MYVYTIYDYLYKAVTDMPKAFTNEERDRVLQTLKEEGRRIFIRFGLRKTTVAELARAAGIAKGSFYLFCPSKELFYYELLEEEERLLKRQLAQIMEDASLSRRQRLKQVLLTGLKETAANPFLRVMLDPDEMRYLLTRLPQERLEEHQQEDAGFAEAILKQWAEEGALRAIPLPVIAGALRGLFTFMTQERVIGEGIHQEVLALYVEALVNHILPEEVA